MNRNNPQLGQYQTKDLGKIFSLGRKIAQRKKSGKPADKLADVLQQLKADSIQVTQSIVKNLPDIKVESELPIFARTENLVELLNTNQVVIVAGETGCGKTTQLPKICLQAGFGVRGKIAHTQPRRLAATSVANRVADELNVPIGEFVGYSVRFANKTSTKTRINLMTDGILLAELQSDPMLSQYEVIIIDEAHERSLNIDFLLGFLKQLSVKRKELKIVITSATIDPDSFSKYFNGAPIVLVEGRTYPVEVRYQPLEDSQESGSTDPVLLGVRSAIDQCMAESTGDILIFSHGENEIKNIAKYLHDQHFSQTDVLPLYARLGIKEQQAIFKTSSNRKIIIATNVAETSLTIPNIVFVIDIGTARVSRYSQRNKIQQLPVEKISKSSAEQRKGRCGRICPGICVRLYSEEDFNNRREYTEAEISRTNLSSVVLRLKSLRVDQVESFPFIESPDERQWRVAFNLLFELAAMDDKRNITEIGRRMSLLPLDPQLARILLDKDLVAVEEMLVVVSFLSVRDVRLRPHDKQQKADQLHAQYKSDSDILSIIKLWNQLQQQRKIGSSNQFRRWCQKNLINFVGWYEWRNVYFQIKESLQDIGIYTKDTVATADEVHRALVSGFVGHLLLKSQEKYYQGARGIKVWLHPSSMFFNKKANWLLSTELIETDKVYARTNAPIKPEWIEQVAPHLLKSNYQDVHWRKNRGAAGCFLNQTVLGLPIVNRRLIDYSNVDRLVSRELFLKEGLANDQVNQDFPFLQSNRKAMNELKEQEEKLRTTDIRIDSDRLSQLYAETIPDYVISVNSLRKWLKKDWKARNKLLTFTSDSLSQRTGDSVEEYPSEIFVRGVQLPLSYCFSPGEPEDGVTVEIPSKMVQQFKESDFDWLVPGYLQQKILHVLKALPKVHRKSLIPLAESAELCSKAILQQDYLQQPFRQVLVKTLLRLKNLRLQPEELELTNLPTHLQMKFSNKASNGKNRVIKNRLNDLKMAATIKQENSDKENEGYSQTSEKYYSWPKFSLELERNVQHNGQQIRLFSGLVDKKNHVEISTFPDLASATESHHQGIVRLIILDQMPMIKDFKNTWPDRHRLEVANLRFGGFDVLLDWSARLAALEFVEEYQSPICDSGAFKEVCSIFLNNGRERVALLLNHWLRLLRQQNQVYERLSELRSPVYKDSVKDINQQLSELWRFEPISNLGSGFHQDYARYLSAIDSRIGRVLDNFPKEQQALDNFQEWNEWWYELESERDDFTLKSLKQELFWMMQEYRVSMFATNVKAKGGISGKKLQKKFDQIEVVLAQM